ncbi:MAG TPA: glycoside hydrolase family 15 protein [Rhizomicrobium sp.]|nr:glycoside hydrolase family 15 protein [Rhizomicrobium sp.]
MSELERWIAREWDHAAAMMLKSISPREIIKERKHFRQVIIPKAGSVVASPVLAAYDPEPDYFFHWYRDSALVMDALRLVRDELPVAEELFQDFVRFSLDLHDLDGRKLPAHWREDANVDFVQFLRTDAQNAHGTAIPAETRINPDGSLDITDWPRPQNDGPALRALCVMRWGADGAAGELLRRDLAFVLRHARQPCFDIWEEERGLHAYTLRVSAAALEEGASWLETHGETHVAGLCRAERSRLEIMLDDFWMAEQAHLRSRFVDDGMPEKLLDMSVILGANHARVSGERYQQTLARLENLFDAAYAINQHRPPSRAPALGRYQGDRYYSGGAYYFTTLAAAEFHYRSGDLAKGDAFLETVRAFTPESGDLSEQFDQTTGAQTSARHLAWSYAAFLTAAAARGALCGARFQQSRDWGALPP